MGIVVDFTDYKPRRRTDQPWTGVFIEEATTVAGPWQDDPSGSAIDTITFTTPDADPRSPAFREFTTTNGTIEQGWYRVTFFDADGNIEHTPPVHNLGPAADYDNRPTVEQLRLMLTGLPGLVALPDEGLHLVLDAAIAYVETVATTSFNGIQTLEPHDGNTTNEMTLYKRPATSIVEMEVHTPILGFVRIYKGEEIQLYRREGIVKIFTYKLAVEQALLNTLDYQAWGTIFPPTPNSVRITYTYGYPQYDAANDRTTLDGGVTWEDGDQRDPTEQRWLGQLRQAALCDAAASFLGQTGGLGVGVVQSVSFDGYSKSMNPAAYGPQVQALITRRDEILNRRRRRFFMATVG